MFISLEIKSGDLAELHSLGVKMKKKKKIK